MSETPKNIPNRFADAQPGDWLWVWDINRPKYDANGNYCGRGGYVLRQVTGLTRQSIEIEKLKFSLETGEERGAKYTPQKLFGDFDRDDEVWFKNRREIARAVESCTNIDVLKQIGILVGWPPKDPNR